MGKSGELLDPVSKFFDRSNPEVPMTYLLGATRFGGRSKLYLLQHEGYSNWWIRESSTRSYDSYQGCIFDTMTKELMPFKRPDQIKKAALLISAYGKLYHLAYPSAYRSMSGMPDPSFEVYDPDTGSWSRLSTFPRYQMKWCNIDIIGYAVCYDCIWISLEGHERGKFWVYQVTMDKWKEVNMPADRDSRSYYYSFKGRAVVVDNTIYAFSSVGGVIAFSLMMELTVVLSTLWRNHCCCVACILVFTWIL